MKDDFGSSNSLIRNRLTVITDTFPPDVNGVSMTLSQLVNRLAARGYHVEVVYPKPIESKALDWHERVSLRKVRGVSLPGYPELRLGLPRALSFAKEWRALPPRAIYVATEGMMSSSAVSTARALGIRVVSGYHTHFSQYLKHYHLPLIDPLV